LEDFDDSNLSPVHLGSSVFAVERRVFLSSSPAFFDLSNLFLNHETEAAKQTDRDTKKKIREEIREVIL